MLVILDGGKRLAFQRPVSLIAADNAADVPAAMAAIEAAVNQGRFVAGWLGYELGYALEPKLAHHIGQGPLLRLGVFDKPSDVPPAMGRAWAGTPVPEWNEKAYTARFDRVKALIAAGDIYQANLSFRARFPFLGDARALYEDLLAASGAGHCGYVDDGARHILSLSPELFFDLAADGRITVRPMKGTWPRGGDDVAERAALAASQKDRAENLMIVDLIRNDLSRIGGDVAVETLFQVETYPTLHTMVSTVTAKTRAGAGAGDILRALFPCGSITGAPKIRAMEILHQLEASPRGPYCGAVGHFAPDGSARFNVAIRTLTIDGDASSETRAGALGVGGGVVQDSRAASEYAECLLKARFFAPQPLRLIETLRWNDGFTRLEQHLCRMEASARVFQMPYATPAAMLALDAALAGKQGPQRVRLTLDVFGVHHATTAPLESNPPHWTYRIADTHTHSGDALLAHKTSRRELYDAPHPGVDELVFVNERGEVTEGARSNIFVRRDDLLLTPPLSAGVLPGILRAELIARGRAREALLMPDDLEGEVWLGNSLRGLIRAVKP
jgi:para-aminobenzoate synthetase/4-amino-4-deoxychorismate lyase